MENLTFGEQVKIILSRKGMTIKELAEQIEERTGKNMSRQNMTQRLKRDNFQEQDMRMIAEILGCSFRLSIMEQIEMETEKEQIKKGKPQSQKHAAERDITVGELVKMSEELQLEKESEKKEPETPVLGEINPYTGKEYQTNSVRIHPKRIGYVQVYDQEQHKWTDMTEWAFLGYQERKKALLGKDYDPPIYLD